MSTLRRHIHFVARTALCLVAACAFVVYGIVSAGAAQERAQGVAAGSGQRGPYLKDGTFAGQARGYGGLTDVAVTVANGYIVDVEISSHHDDSPYIDDVEGQLLPDIVASQTYDVDVVTNASYSSNGVRYAVRNALVGAGALSEADAASSKTATAARFGKAAASDSLYDILFTPDAWQALFADKSSNNSTGFAGGGSVAGSRSGKKG